MMNFKTKSVFTLMILSLFLLSSCEVYKTLYGTPDKLPDKGFDLSGFDNPVVRVEAATEEMLAQEVYAADDYVPHDPFKLSENPLGPFEAGAPLGFTLGEWLAATGEGYYGVVKGNAVLELTFDNLVPEGVYTLWCSTMTPPLNFEIVDMPCGDEDGSDSIIEVDEDGHAEYELELDALELSTEESTTVIALAYHSDGETHGEDPGDFGLSTHVQLFYMIPVLTDAQRSYEFDIGMMSHIDAGLPEQDVFLPVEKEESMEEGTEDVMEKEIVEEEVMEKEIAEEDLEDLFDDEVVEEETEVIEPGPREKPIVVVVQETNLVSLLTTAEDPDSDTVLVFTYTSPLTDEGQWQTRYGDSGEYTITVTASDGESTTSRDVLIIVNKKEESPTIGRSRPIETALTIDETEAIDFSVQASDLNNDPLTYEWKLDGARVGASQEYTYISTFDDAGTHTIKIDVTDGLGVASKLWSVDVENVNRVPVLEFVDDIFAKETDRIVIAALATDDDLDEIEYSLSDSRFEQDDNVFTWQTSYESAGTYTVTLSATDGQDMTEQEITVVVDNVNRPPVIKDIVQG